MRCLIILTLLISVTLFVGCNSGFTRPDAASLIKSEPLGEMTTPTIIGDVGRFRGGPHNDYGGCEFLDSNYSDILLYLMGYLEVKPLPERDALLRAIAEFKQLPKGQYQVSLSKMGKQQLAEEVVNHPYSKQLNGGCETEQFSYKIADREFDKVTGITGEGNERRAEFHWKWKLTSYGSSLIANNSPLWRIPREQRTFPLLVGFVELDQDPDYVRFRVDAGGSGTAWFRKYDDGWRIERLEVD